MEHEAVTLDVAATIMSYIPHTDQVWDRVLARVPIGYWHMPVPQSSWRQRDIPAHNTFGVTGTSPAIYIHLLDYIDRYGISINLEDNVVVRKTDLNDMLVDYMTQAAIMLETLEYDSEEFRLSVRRRILSTLDKDCTRFQSQPHEMYVWLSINLLMLGVEVVNIEDIANTLSDLDDSEIPQEVDRLSTLLRNALRGAVTRL